MPVTEPHWKFVQIKAYGDLTIAAAVLRSVPEAARPQVGLLISPHLVALTQVLDPPCSVQVLPLATAEVPALFDWRPRRHHEKLWSAWQLRGALGRAAGEATLVMRHLERAHPFILGRCASAALPESGNLYAAYEDFLRGIAGDLQPALPDGAVSRRPRILLCPISRVRWKTLPSELVSQFYQWCTGAGWEAELLVLEGETFPVTEAIPTRIIPRQFSALSEALASCAAVVSADSLPAHLAEYRRTPVFVVSPEPNEYWLPPSAYANQAWGVFPDPTACAQRFAAFLARLPR